MEIRSSEVIRQPISKLVITWKVTTTVDTLRRALWMSWRTSVRREDNDSGLALASVGDFLIARFFIALLLYGRRRCVCKRRNAGAGGRFVCGDSALAGEEIRENAGDGGDWGAVGHDPG